MSDWIKAINPTAGIATQDEATTAARASVFGILLGMLNTAAEGWYAQQIGPQTAARGIEAMTGQPATAEQIQSAGQFGLMGMGLLIALQVVLAVVQWRKPNQVVPILFLVLVVWTLGGVLVSPLLAEQVQAAGAQMRPMWLAGVSIVTLGLALIFHVAGVRGGSALAKFRQAQAY